MNIESWNGSNGYNNRLVSQDNGSTGGLTLTLRNYSGVHMLVFTPDRWNTTCVSGNIPDSWIGNWHHVAVTYRSGSVCFSFDGVASTTASCGTSVVDVNSAFTIGAYPAGSEEFDGILDDFRVWNDVRTSSEIADNYDCTLAGTEAGLGAYWKFDDSLSDSAVGNNLTQVSSPTYSSNTALTGACSGGGGGGYTAGGAGQSGGNGFAGIVIVRYPI